MTTLATEFRRVFGSFNESDDGRIYVDGWPEAIAYDADAALPVLGRFSDGYGGSDAGDAEVCRALEEAGAVRDGTVVAMAAALDSRGDGGELDG